MEAYSAACDYELRQLQIRAARHHSDADSSRSPADAHDSLAAVQKAWEKRRRAAIAWATHSIVGDPKQMA